MTGLVWLYGVTAAASAPPTAGLAGVAGEPVRLVEADPLTAAVGTVPEADFAEEPLKEHLEDLRWLERAARAHHLVIEEVFRHGDTVPLRFATVYRDDDSVRAVLRDRADDFAGALDLVRGKEEWGVKAYVDPGAAPESPAGDPAAGGTSGGAGGTGGGADAGGAGRPGTAYLLRRKARQGEREQAFRRARERGDGVRAALQDLAVRAVAHPPQDQRLAGYQGWMILNDSYLVGREHAAEFAAAVRACAERFPEVDLDVSGPWPPYSFVGTAEEPPA
jgi:hypothetical protein